MNRPLFSLLDRRFFKAFLPPMTAVMLALVAVSVYISYQNTKERTLREGQRLIDVNAHSLQKPLWDLDRQSIEAILQALADLPDVRAITLSEFGQKDSLSFGKQIEEAGGPVFSRELYFTDSSDRTYALGTLNVQLKKLDFWSMVTVGLEIYLPLIAAVVLCSVITGLIVNRRLVTYPLEIFRDLIETASPEAQRKLSSLDMSKDELGKVMQAYLDIESQRQYIVKEWKEAVDDAQKIVNSMADMVFIHPWQPESLVAPSFIQVNERAIKDLGYTREELLALGPGRIDDTSDEKSDQLVAQIKRHGHAVFETNLKHKNGTWIPVEISTSVGTISGRPTAIAVARSLVETKKREAELRAAVAQAEDANRAKSEFIANVSHEIRTPLNAIIGFSEFLSDALADEDHRQKVQIIAHSGQILLTLVNDILDLAKIEAGHLSIIRQPVDVLKFFEEIASLFSFQAETRELDFAIELSPDLPPYLLLDEIRLRQILVNLLGNAFKFTEVGRVEFRVTVEETPLSSPSRGRVDLEISVTDTGPGVPDAFKPAIFKNFEQLALSSHQQKGTGLGLPIASHLSRLMGGTIHLTDNPSGLGSVFTFHLENVPIVGWEESRHGGAITPPLGSRRRFVFQSHPLILIIDDIANNRILLENYLHKAGFPFISAENGREGLEQVCSRCPALVLTDIRMPVMDGREFLQALRTLEHAELAQIPVIAITASAMPDQVTKGSKAFDGFLTKPLSAETLLAELARFLPHEVILEEPQRPESYSGPISAAALEVLDEAWLERLQHMASQIPVEEIKVMAGEMEELARSHHDRTLEQMALSLGQAAQHFDIATIEGKLREFLKIIEEGQAAKEQRPKGRP